MGRWDKSTDVTQFSLREFIVSKKETLELIKIFMISLSLAVLSISLTLFLHNQYVLSIGLFCANYFVAWSFMKSNNIVMPFAVYLAYNLIVAHKDIAELVQAIIASSMNTGLIIAVFSMLLYRSSPKSHMINNRILTQVGLIICGVLLMIFMQIQAVPIYQPYKIIGNSTEIKI